MAGDDYLLDTGVSVEARGNYFGLDLCPGFWDALRRSRYSGVASIPSD
jgi:hypothetical protein